MRNGTKIFIIIEIQIILLLIVFMIVKVEKLNKKVYNTNKFVYEVLSNKRIELLNTINEEDIIIGKADAPVTMIVYSRFDCSACNSFFIDNYEQLKNEFIDNGIVKLVVRYLVHQSKPRTLYSTKCAYYAFQKGYYDTFLNQMGEIYPTIDTSAVKNIMLDLKINLDSLNNFTENVAIEKKLLKQANEMRNAGIRYTPTIFVNKQQLIGNRNFENLKRIIFEELDNEICE